MSAVEGRLAQHQAQQAQQHSNLIDQACQRWNKAYAQDDPSLAVDGKTMCHAHDEHGQQTHIMSVVGHQTGVCHTQKKSVPCR